MICPHCLISIHPGEEIAEYISEDKGGTWVAESYICPSCGKSIIFLLRLKKGGYSTSIPPDIKDLEMSGLIKEYLLVYPKGTGRNPCPPEVPPKYKEDYEEACLVLKDSPKASAALSRRCLQSLIHDELRIKKRNLSDEIDEAINTLHYPSHISDLLHALRTVGNFSAHPNKDTNTGEIIDVEPEEAEFCLELLEALFDYHFVQPVKNQKRKDSINAKLTAAGQKPI